MLGTITRIFVRSKEFLKDKSVTMSIANILRRSRDSKVIKLIRDLIQSVKVLSKDLAAQLQNIDAEKIVDYLVTDGLRTITWNHGKVLAVNGKVVMTGGGNYWDAYARTDPPNAAENAHGRIDHDIVDHQAKVAGDAAVSAHRWADYFWK